MSACLEERAISSNFIAGLHRRPDVIVIGVTLTTVAGVTVVVVTGLDLLLTVLHPTRSGFMSRAATSAVWRSIHTTGSRFRMEFLVSYGGVLIMLGQLITWILGFWLGFAMIYAGHLDQLAFLTSDGFGNPTVVDALYLSGASLTTVGFGDLVAGTDTLRLVTVLEAACGLAVITSAVAYLLSVYPLASEIRAAARQLGPAQKGDRGAAEMVFHGGRTQLDSLRRDLIQLDESTQRFPALYYFHADDPSASLSALIRGATLVVMQLRYGISTKAVPHARWHGEVLDTTLESVIRHFESRFFSSDADSGMDLTADEVDDRIREMRNAASEVTGEMADDVVDREGFVRLMSRSDSFLSELERHHLYPHDGL